MDDSTLARKVVVTNRQGLHARPADLFTKLASRYESRIEVVKGSTRVNGKSILDILTLGAAQGTELSIEASGRDAEMALSALVELIEQGLAENEAIGELEQK